VFCLSLSVQVNNGMMGFMRDYKIEKEGTINVTDLVVSCHITLQQFRSLFVLTAHHTAVAARYSAGHPL